MDRYFDPEVIVMKLVNAVGLVLVAVAAVEAFYVHPTRGRGLKALLAVIQAGEAL